MSACLRFIDESFILPHLPVTSIRILNPPYDITIPCKKLTTIYLSQPSESHLTYMLHTWQNVPLLYYMCIIAMWITRVSRVSYMCILYTCITHVFLHICLGYTPMQHGKMPSANRYTGFTLQYTL